jgi:hypothetical protein
MRVFGRVGWSLLLHALFLGCFTRGVAQSVTAKLSLVFEPNRGQVSGDVRYVLRQGALEGEFQRDGVRLRLLSGKKNDSQVSLRLVDARKDVAISGDGELEGHTNYLLGSDPAHWLRGLPNYSEVRYSQIYPGTDLVFYGNGGVLEHDFELQPGADPARIAFQLDEAQSVTLEDDGNLRIGLANGAILFKRPVAYQMAAGVRRNVDAAFTVDRNGTVRFRLGNYNRTAKLVIDPVLTFSTYLSSLAPDANLIATDGAGNNYVSGYATLGFPVTSGAFAGCANCTVDSAVTFISKLSADGTSLIYSTVLGGNSFAQPTGIAVDGSGDALVSGWTGASDFPTKNGQQIATQNNNYVGFLVSLSPDGSSLNYGTLLGSSPSASQSAMTYATAVALDSSGNSYVTGDTGNGFFTTAGALNQGSGGDFGNEFNVYLAKFSPTGTLIYSAVLGAADPQNGGGGPIGASAIAVDAAGDAFVAGQAGILWPVSSNAYLTQIAGAMPYADPFVTEVSPDAKSLVYSTFLDYAYVVTGIAVVSSGDVFVTGDGVGASYPTTPNAYQQNSGGGSAFLTELNSTGSGLAYSTVIGDSSYKINGLALDTNGDIWLAGQTSNPQFPLVAPIQATFPAANGFPGVASVVSQFDPTGETLKFSTFLGGSAQGYASSVAIDANHKVHVSGAAQYGMYTTPGVYAGSVPAPGSGYSEATYAYVSLIDPSTSTGTLCFGGYAASGLSFGFLPPGSTASQTVQVTNCGSATLVIASIASNNAAFTVPSADNSCTGSIAIGSSCSVSVGFTPTAVQTYTGQLTFTSNASIATTSIPISGSGGEPVAGFGPRGVTQTLVFSPLLVGQTSAAQYIALYNNGTVPLTINQTTVTTDFALAPGGTCPGSLPAYASCLISVVFAPTTAGTFNGTLSVSSNDPVHPTISTSITGTAFTSYPIATITALLNPSYPINSGTAPITMSIFGSNFFAGSVVYVNGVAQTTNYQSGSFLTASFSPSILNAVGTIPVTVVNPAPGGGSSASYPLTAYLSIPLTASALTVDPVGGLLYAAIPSSASQSPNTVIPINPSSGATMTPIAVGNNPQKLAISDDGSELYVASTGVLQRFNLKTLALEKTFSLPVDPEWGQTYAEEMHVVPGSPHSIVVELFASVDPAEDGAALYNDTGLVNWIPGQSLVNGGNSIFWMDSFTFTSSSMIYGLPEPQLGTFFLEVPVSPSGLSYNGTSAGETNVPTSSIVRSDGTLLYTNSGEVWNPSAMTLLGTYLESNGSQIFYAPSVIPETANSHTYFLDAYAQYSQYEAVNIDVYDQSSYALLGTVPFTSIYPPDVSDLVRWGSNGFAFRCVDTQSSANQIVILTSNLIGSSSGAPIPILSSVTPTKVYAGGPAFSIQLTGSGFTAASTVQVNGNSRTTIYVGSTSLTVQVLASDIANVGQLNVQVTTPAPGGGTSNYATVSIDPPQQITPTVTVALSSSSITTAQVLTVTVAVGGGSGNSAPTGSVTLIGGGYTSAATPLTSGSATISVPAGSLTTGSDTLTVTYTPDSASSATYIGASGSNSVTVTTAVSQNFAISGTAISVAPGSTTGNISTISVTPSGGFTGSVTLSAALTASPAGAANLPTFSFGATTPVSVTGTDAGSATLTVSTTQAATGGCSAANLDGRGFPWSPVGGVALACVFVLGIGKRSRKWRTTLGMVAILGALAGVVSACGATSGGCNTTAGSPGTTAGNYTITVTGSSGTITQSGTVTLTVQ